MSEESLTAHEVEILKSEIEKSKAHRIKVKRELVLYQVVGNLLIVTYLRTAQDVPILWLVLAIAGLTLIFLSVMLMAERSAKKSNDSLKNDLASNKKLEGTSSIVRINKLNTKVVLEDGTYVWEPNDHGNRWKLGDLIKYSRTVGNRYVFQAIKVEEQ